MTKPWEHQSDPSLSFWIREQQWSGPPRASTSDHCWQAQGFGSLEVVHPVYGSRGGGSRADSRLDPR